MNEVRKIDEIVWREDLYPRIKTDPVTVQKYAESLSLLPEIEINQHNELIDGWHRWTAYRKQEEAELPVHVKHTDSDAHLLELAITANAKHGLQLSQEDKRSMAYSIYNATPDKDRGEKKAHLSKILSVPERTMREWLSRIDKDSKEARDKRIFELWMQCYTQEEIAEEVNLSRPQTAETIKNVGIGSLAKTDKSAASHATDFEPPIYNIWKQQTKTSGSSHFGNSEVRWVDNLLYLYTEPFDIVVDPFAGGGSTLDICKKRFRRCWISDRLPIVEREKEIRRHEILDTNGIKVPKIRWHDVSLVYLDPPYWKQAAGKYSDDPRDFANMELDSFTKNLAKVINGFAKKLSRGYIALVMSPSQYAAPERAYTDHIADMLRSIQLPVDMRYSVPYESQQCSAQMVDWAKENNKCLVLTREIVVWRVQ